MNDDAIKCYKQEIEMNNLFTPGYYNLGKLYFHEDFYE